MPPLLNLPQGDNALGKILPGHLAACDVVVMLLPEEIIGLGKPLITIVWEHATHESIFSAHALRLQCRCAFCIEEMTGQPLLDPKKVADNVVASRIELLGQYAISVAWSDGHDTSIYSFRDLLASCRCGLCVTSYRIS